MPGRKGLLCILAAILLLPTSVALDLRAMGTATGMHLEWDSLAGVRDPTVVVTHAGEDGTTVVDWIHTLDPSSDMREGSIEIANLSASAAKTVQVIEGASGISTISAVSPLPDVAAIPNGAVAKADVPTTFHIGTAGQPRSFKAYPVSNERAFDPTARIFVTASGAVVAVWQTMSSLFDPETPCGLHAASSLDGGHTFGPTRAFLRAVNTTATSWCDSLEPWSWGATALDSGLVAILSDVRNDAEPALLSLYDPTSNEIVTTTALRGVLFHSLAMVVPTMSGRLLVAGSDYYRSLVRLWDVGLDGSAVERPPLASGGWVYNGRAVSNGLGDLAFVWSSHDVAYFVRSLDDGRTFATPVQLDLGHQDAVELHSAAMDGNGTLHMTVSNSASGGAAYARISKDGLQQVRSLCGAQDPYPGYTQSVPMGQGHAPVFEACLRAQYPTIAATAGHVWLVFERFVFNDGTPDPDSNIFLGAESSDGGRTFPVVYRLKDFPGNRLAAPYDATLFKDGRPVLFAFAFFATPDGSAGQSGGGEDYKDAVIPFFDPLALPRSSTNVTLRIPVAAQVSQEPNIVSEVQATAGGAVVRVSNRGGQTIDDLRVQLVNATTGQQAASAVAPSAVTPGGTVSLAFAGLTAGTSWNVQISAKNTLVANGDFIVPAVPTGDATPANTSMPASVGIPGVPMTALMIGLLALGRQRVKEKRGKDG